MAVTTKVVSELAGLQKLDAGSMHHYLDGFRRAIETQIQNAPDTRTQRARAKRCEHYAEWVEFISQLVDKLPMCTFAIESSYTVRESIQKELVYIYLPTDFCAMGWVGYGDFRVGGAGTRVIGVFSHTIRNGKYDTDRDQYHMRLSINHKPALKNALRNLRPYDPKEVGKLGLQTVSQLVRRGNDQVRTKVREAKELVVEHRSTHTDLARTARYSARYEHLAIELQALVASGHQFVSEGFADAVTAYLAEIAEAKINAPSAASLLFVRTYMANGVQTFDTHLTKDTTSLYSADMSNDPSIQYTSDDLPESISGKLASLMMCEEEEYIAGVGVRLSDGRFYVAITS